MRSLRFALVAFGILPVAFAVACSSSSNAGDDDDTNGGDSGSKTDAGSNDGAPSDGGSLIPALATVIASQSGGFTAGAADGSTCQPIDNTYSIDRTASSTELSWKVCATDDAGVASYAIGDRTLTDTERASLETAIANVKVSTQKVACGSDAPDQSLLVQTADGNTTTIYDESQNCISDGSTYADGVGALIVAASNLAHD